MTDPKKEAGSPATAGSKAAGGDDSLPHVDFATFILSLSHSALMHLGEAPSPYTQAAITAAVRSYAVKLDEVVDDWDPHLQLDNRPLLELLDAVDQQSTP